MHAIQRRLLIVLLVDGFGVTKRCKTLQVGSPTLHTCSIEFLKRQNNEDLPDEAPPPTRHLLNDGILAMGAASETSSGVIISIVSSRTPRRMQRRSTVSTLKARTYLTPRTIMTCITSMRSYTKPSASCHLLRRTLCARSVMTPQPSCSAQW